MRLLMSLMSVFVAAFLEARIYTEGSVAEDLSTLSESEADLYREVASDLRCPTCNGLSILESDAAFSLQIKATIIERIKERDLKPQIIEFFTKRYGLWLLREPPKEGMHLLAWLIPFLIFTLGGGLIFFVYVRRGAKKGQNSADNEVLSLMHAEIARLKESRVRL